jgi:hypothetical protein
MYVNGQSYDLATAWLDGFSASFDGERGYHRNILRKFGRFLANKYAKDGFGRSCTWMNIIKLRYKDYTDIQLLDQLYKEFNEWVESGKSKQKV